MWRKWGQVTLWLASMIGFTVVGIRLSCGRRETPAQYEQQMARYREEDARAQKQQEAYDNNFRVLRDLWVEKCPNGKDPAILMCSAGPPVYIPITYYWGHTLEPNR